MQLWVLIQKNVRSFGNESFVVLEQVTLAALDCNDIDLAKECWSRLDSQHHSSVRVKHLLGLIKEAAKEYDKAKVIYENMLQENEGDLFVRKRLIAISKARGDINETVKKLVDYLDHFPADHEAWSELCSLYTASLDYSKAIQCAEEMLLAQPHNYMYHQRLGELHYSAGGPEHLDMARMYYLHALRLKPDDLRSLYGLYLVVSLTTSGSTASGKKTSSDKENSTTLLPERIMDKIKSVHEKAFAKDELRRNILNASGSILIATGPSSLAQTTNS